MPVREGARRVQIPNSGLAVFLYDEGNREAIRSEYPDVVFSLSEMSHEDRKLKRLAERGLFVAYELYQDDAVDVEVVVGAPLTAAEKKGLAFMRPQVALLSLPTGRLSVESADTCPLGDPVEAAGPGVAVPPGEYVLTLLRIDHEAMEQRGLAYEGPQEILSLTPLADARALKKPDGFLRFGQPTLRGVTKVSVEEGRILGLVLAVNQIGPSLFTNISTSVAARAGLVRGMRLRLRVDGGPAHDALFTGGLDVTGRTYEIVYPGRRSGEPGFDVSWFRYPGRKERWLRVTPAGQGATPLRPVPVAGVALEFEIAGPSYHPAPDLSWAGRWTLADGLLRAEVLACAPRGIVLNVPAVALEGLGARPGDVLTLSAPGVSRRVVLATDPRQMYQAQMQFQRARPSGSAEEIAEARRVVERTAFRLLKTPLDHPGREAIAEELEAAKTRLGQLQVPAEAASGMPLVTEPIAHWDLSGEPVLGCWPLLSATASVLGETGLDLPVGSPVTLGPGSP